MLRSIHILDDRFLYRRIGTLINQGNRSDSLQGTTATRQGRSDGHRRELGGIVCRDGHSAFISQRDGRIFDQGPVLLHLLVSFTQQAADLIHGHRSAQSYALRGDSQGTDYAQLRAAVCCMDRHVPHVVEVRPVGLRLTILIQYRHSLDLRLNIIAAMVHDDDTIQGCLIAAYDGCTDSIDFPLIGCIYGQVICLRIIADGAAFNVSSRRIAQRVIGYAKTHPNLAARSKLPGQVHDLRIAPRGHISPRCRERAALDCAGHIIAEDLPGNGATQCGLPIRT